MGRIFITGSADGLGLLSARALSKQGHEVVLHARNKERKQELLKKMSGASVVTGDLSDVNEIKSVADQVNTIGVFDAVIHNAGVYQVSPQVIFTVNTVAPYLLTCLIQKPRRLIYLSSGMHLQGRVNLDGISKSQISYSDSKLHVLMLAKAVTRIWPEVYSNAVDPGWVPTKMGGHGAPDNLQKGFETQMWLATSDDTHAKVSGSYFYHQQERRYNPLADDLTAQQEFLSRCKDYFICFPEQRNASGNPLPTCDRQAQAASR